MGTIHTLKLGARYRNKNNHTLPHKIALASFWDHSTGIEHVLFRNVNTGKVFLHSPEGMGGNEWYEAYEEVPSDDECLELVPEEIEEIENV